ncbi:class I SAM-dependent methyltransferase [Halomicrobium sp. IBSBa]|uniref:class I SAM-dependent methyltransferase n=1 Tax=Halomicrobium sp. IBSBa TaxID=2778916 RepID=UPI001ABF4FF7|nr:class I SAM-dependent methyltransferase [Halomicrobium sp. IBSBa]MBO4247094.1 class I SAM-dependent methyltransferase [Halomicrobium sp. IBSBa]
MSIRRGIRILKEDGLQRLLKKAGHRMMSDLGVLNKVGTINLWRAGRDYEDARWLTDNARDRHDALIGPDKTISYPGKDVRAKHLNRYVFAKNECLSTKTAPSILDVACGTGYGYHIFNKSNKSIRYTSGDISARTLQYANKYYGGASYIQLSAEALPLQKNEFDIVVSFETLEHLPSPGEYLAEIERTSKPTADIFLSVPYNQDLDIESETDVKSYPHLHKFGMSDFREMLENHFRLENIKYYHQNQTEEIEHSGETTHTPSGISQFKPAKDLPQRTETLLAHIDQS